MVFYIWLFLCQKPFEHFDEVKMSKNMPCEARIAPKAPWIKDQLWQNHRGGEGTIATGRGFAVFIFLYSKNGRSPCEAWRDFI